MFLSLTELSGKLGDLAGDPAALFGKFTFHHCTEHFFRRAGEIHQKQIFRLFLSGAVQLLKQRLHAAFILLRNQFHQRPALLIRERLIPIIMDPQSHMRKHQNRRTSA